MDRPTLRKPKLHFETVAGPSHVTFDDGKERRLNLPWTHYVQARWDYAEPDTIKIEIGEWRVVLRGHNLAPLFRVIEEQTLIRIRARPDLEADRENEADSFATRISFLKISPAGPGKAVQNQQELELE